MENLKNKIINQTIKGISYYYTSKLLNLMFDNGICITFLGCELVIDLGIIGNEITFISDKGTLGAVLELKKQNINPSDYNFLLISKNIDDYLNKCEMIVVYESYNILG